MKGLFVVFHGFAAYNGISKKIFYQRRAMERCGVEIPLCSLAIDAEGYYKRMIDDQVVENFGKGILAKIKKRTRYGSLTDYIQSADIDFLYVRSDHNANPFLIHWFHQLKKRGIKIIMEIPTYPYDPEYARSPWKRKLSLKVDQLFRKTLARYIDRMVTFSQADQIFGVPTLKISNGIDFDNIPLKAQRHNAGGSLRLIGVADIHFWHGFDRVIEGMGRYYAEGGTRPVEFHIVGGGVAATLNELHAIVARYGLENRVFFDGPLWDHALDQAFDEADLGIASLGRHRNGILHIKTLKNREYAARGLAFIYSECDEDFDMQPYVMKVAPDESPVNIARLIDFYDRMRLTPLQIRASIRTSLSWDTQMCKVLNMIQRLN